MRGSQLVLAQMAFNSAFVLGCGGDAQSSSDGGLPSQTDGSFPLDVGSEASTADAEAYDADEASCYVVASDYDQTCDSGSDCVLVPPGGNICAPCHNSAIWCNVGSVSNGAYLKYSEDLSAVLDRQDGRSGRSRSAGTVP